MSLKKILHPANFLGYRTNRKIVVIESDDWGNEKFSNIKHYQQALKNNLIDNSAYFKYDSLESNEDLEQIMELLIRFKDKNGNPPILTANYVTANPDYEKIKAEHFKTYFYKPSKELYSKYLNKENVPQLYVDAISKKLIKPQYHCREHIDVDRWLMALKKDDIIAKKSFENKFVSIGLSNIKGKRKGITAAYDFDSDFDVNNFRSNVLEMKSMFFDMFGFHATTFIAPAYTWHESLENFLAKIGVNALQGNWKQTSPYPADKVKSYRYIKHYLGQKNKHNQIYLVRNASFEPTIKPKTDAVNDCLESISMAFKFGKPAIISSHRVNFIGSLDEGNRTRNLKLLKQLLSEIVKRWPDVEFMSSDELGNLIHQAKK